MLSSVLRSQRAIRVNVEIMRAFVRLRRMLVSHDELAQKVASLERRYDGQFKVVFEAIRKLMAPPAAPHRTIGFRPAHRSSGTPTSRMSGAHADLPKPASPRGKKMTKIMITKPTATRLYTTPTKRKPS